MVGSEKVENVVPVFWTTNKQMIHALLEEQDMHTTEVRKMRGGRGKKPL